MPVFKVSAVKLYTSPQNGRLLILSVYNSQDWAGAGSVNGRLAIKLAKTFVPASMRWPVAFPRNRSKQESLTRPIN